MADVSRCWFTTQQAYEITQGLDGFHLHTGHQRGLLRVRSGYHYPVKTGRRQGEDGGDNSGHRTQPPIESQLAQQHPALQRGSGNHAVRRQYGGGNSGIEAAPGFG